MLQHAVAIAYVQRNGLGDNNAINIGITFRQTPAMVMNRDTKTPHSLYRVIISVISYGMQVGNDSVCYYRKKLSCKMHRKMNDSY